MDVRSNVRDPATASDRDATTHDLMHQIVKLRWMGLADEAEEVRRALRKAEPGLTLLAGPFDTD